MKTSRMFLSGTCVLLASVLGQAQSTTMPQTPPPKPPATTPAPAQTPPSPSISNQPRESQHVESSQRDQDSAKAPSRSTRSTGVQANTTTTEIDPQVRTVVQEIDTEGPVVVDRISTHFADVTCTEENARALVTALHDGSAVTLRGDNGQVATFTPTGRLGYGEAYIAMSLAVEALRQAGISGCATPAQWQAVLLGGDLGTGTRTTMTVTTEHFPGILVLRQREGGWAQVAQTTHLELNQVVSQANSNLQLKSTNTSQTDVNQQKSLTPTGQSRDYNPRANPNANSSTSTAPKDNPAQTTEQQAPDKSPPPTGHLGDHNPRQQDASSSSDKSGAATSTDKDSSGRSSPGHETEEERKKREKGY